MIGSARKGFSWKTARDWLEGDGELRELLEGWGGMWITASERKKSAKVCWGPSLWQRHGPFSGSAALRLQRGDFFIYLFNFMPCRPQNGPIPSPKLPCPCLWLATPILSPKRETHCFELVVVFSWIRRGREFEAGDLRTCIEKSWICGSVILFTGCFSRCGNCSELKRGSQGLLEKPWQVLELVLDIRGLLWDSWIERDGPAL